MPHRASNTLWPEKGLNKKLKGLELTEMVGASQNESAKILKYTTRSNKVLVKVKLLPKCNLGFIYECVWVKPSCKCMIMMKESF